MIRVNRFVLAVYLLALPMAAHANCDMPKDQAESTQCLGDELTQSDKTINDTYQTLRGKLDDDGRLKLRDEQRAWLKERADVCRIDDKISDRAKWLAAILKDPAKTVCVVRYTRQREGILAASVTSGTVEEAKTPTDAIYEITSRTAHKTGKWYFEVTIQTGQIAAERENEFAIGADGPNGGGMAYPEYIRKNQKSDPAVTVGIAVDLDNDKIYFAENGEFSDAPGSSGGDALKPNKAYQAYFSSSSDMSDLLKSKLVQTNFGDHPFAYAMPAGYKAFGQ